MSEIKVNSIKGVGASAAAITVNNTDGTCTANITNSLSNRNRIINGACTIAQRQTSAVTVSSDTYGVDRTYAYENTDGAITVEQSTESPDNFVNSLKATVTTADSSLAAGQYVFLAQAIEGNNVADIAWGTSAAKRVALSFYVKSSVTGTFSGSMKTDSNTNYPFTYTIANTNWNRYTINVPPVTTGTLTTNNGTGVRIYWSLGVGSDYQGSAGSWTTSGGTKIGASGETALIGTNSATFHITGIQFEVSANGIATDFEHRSYGEELARCQRYYEIIKSVNLQVYAKWGNGDVSSPLFFKVTKRGTPTVTNSGGTFVNYNPDGWGTNTPSILNISESSCSITSNRGGAENQLFVSGVDFLVTSEL